MSALFSCQNGETLRGNAAHEATPMRQKLDMAQLARTLPQMGIF
jgi:hypothetical protein